MRDVGVNQNEEFAEGSFPHTPKELFLDPSEWRRFLDLHHPEGIAIKDPNLNYISTNHGWKPWGPYIQIGSHTFALTEFPESPIITAIQDALSGQVQLGNYKLASLFRREGNNSISSVPALVNESLVVAIIHGENAYLAEHAPHLLKILISERNLLASKPGLRAPEVDALVHHYHQRAILIAGFLGITRPEINFRICTDLGERDRFVSNQESLLGPLPLDWCVYRSGDETFFRQNAFAWSYNNHNNAPDASGYYPQIKIDESSSMK